MRFSLLLGLVGSIAAIGALDVASGAAYGMSLFYLAPVAIASWRISMRVGLALAVVAALLWFFSELSDGPYPVSATLWNGFTRLVIYCGAAAVLASLRADRRRMHELLVSAESSARTDPLTGLANSRAFNESLRAETTRLKRYGKALTIAYIDIDNFKCVNDQHGHSKGDDVLKQIADALRGTVRAGDLAARLGGDEFAVALWETSADQLHGFEDRLRAALTPIASQFPGTGLGASIGFAVLGPNASFDDAIKAADEAMYAAKAARKRAAAQSADLAGT